MRKVLTMIKNYIEELLDHCYTWLLADPIFYLACVCARFQSNPKESHIITAKRIIRYLKGTSNLGLWYSRDSSLNLIGYSDADYGGYKIDRKSTSDTCQFLGSNLISWHHKK